MPLSAGSRLGAYEILGPLGAGGMGEVYRARDPKLGRDVAIKVLPENVARDPERLARFEREARSLAALNHPGIVTIFAVEESEGARFLAMELVEGDGLDTLVPAGGLPLPRFLEIAVPLAEALSAAHERGIVHRDLKPGNVMVTREGRVKVLDFGLARVEAADSNADLTSTPTESRVTNLTSEGQVFGTVAYMSPEQARGARVDARSDVFALGIVMYQMLTGERPFQGATAVDVISSILRDRPASVTDLRADLPPGLARVIRRCLEKEPRDRYQTSRDVYNELRELRGEVSSGVFSSEGLPRPGRAADLRAPTSASRPPHREIPWIAVLPFQGPAADAELEAFADGLNEDITTGLSRFRYLSVVARASTARLKGQTQDVRSVAAELEARYVVEGSVRKGGASVRVSARLIEADTGTQLWAGTYDRDLRATGILEVQDDVAARIVATVADSYGVLVRSLTESAAIQRKSDPELSPSEWLFQYFAYRQQLTPQAHAALKSRLEAAVRRDAGPSDLWACLALVHTDEYAFGFQNDAATLDRALAAARRAVELDRTNQFGLLALAQAYFFRQELAAFRPAAEQAMALNQLNTDALGILGLMIVHTGEFQRGAAIVRRAMELNPSHAGWFHFAPIWEHFERAEYEHALEHAMQVNMPGLFWQPLVIAAICGQLGRRAEGASAVRDLLALDPDFARHGRRDIEVWHFASGLLDRILDGVRIAGLDVGPEGGPAAPPSTRSAAVATPSSETPTAGVFWIAVLPFTYSGGDPELVSFAEGLAEDIHAGLAKFPYLSVISRNSTLRFKTQASDVRTVGQTLGVRYVLEGGIRKSGSALRVNVQLVDAQTGAHLWAETYNRDLKSSDVLAVQDDVTDRVVATVADTSGALVRSMAASVEEKPDAELTATDVVLRHWRYQHRGTPAEHARVRDGLEKFVEREPGHADVWACLARLYVHEFALGFNPRPDPLGRALRAAQRAIDLDPTCQHARAGIAQVHFFRREVPAFRAAAEQAIALNPRDTDTLGVMGNMLADSGDFERGVNLVRRAMELNPHFPDWFRFALTVDHFQKADYVGALDEIARVNMPGFFWKQVWIAACAGLAGRPAEAAAAVEELRRTNPDIERQAREFMDSWLYASGLTDRFMEGLRKAGLEIPARGEPVAPPPGGPRSSPPISGAARAEEGFRVAVLPFQHTGGTSELAALAEGMTDAIVTGLSRFSYLRVISRSSTRKFAGETADARAVGRELDARYVMEGSLRQAGTRLRVAVQVVDAASGAQLWSETYDQEFRPEAVFGIQDALVPRIVSTIADMNGVLPRSMSDALRHRPPESLAPQEAVLRSFGYWERVTPEDLAASRSALERAVREEPANADAWAMLGLLGAQDYAQGFGLQSDALEKGFEAARRAVDLAPTNPLAHFALAQALFFRKELDKFRHEAERTVSLNPMDGSSLALVGEMLGHAGEWDRALALTRRARELNPHHPGWYWYVDFYDAYRRHDYRSARDVALKIGATNHWGAHLLMAAACAQLGDREAAAQAVREAVRLRPSVAETFAEDARKWFDPGFAAQLIDGLRKAGLDVRRTSGEAAAAPAPDVPGVPTGPKKRTWAMVAAAGVVAILAALWIARSRTAPARPPEPPSAPQAIRSLAVLPLDNYSGDPSQDYFAEGMTDELTSQLANISQLRVISRGSATQFKGRSRPPTPEIAKKLGVDAVVEGSVIRSGDKVRINAQLIDARSDRHLWAKSFERSSKDVLALQDELASSIAREIHVTLTPEEESRLAKAPSVNPQAYDAYLKGRYFFNRPSDENLSKAIAQFEEATRIDPKFAPAYSGLSDAYLWAAFNEGVLTASQAKPKAKAAADTAIQLDDDSAEGHTSLATYKTWFEYDWAGSEAEYRRALRLNPNYAFAHDQFGLSLAFQGRLDESIAEGKRATELDPLSPQIPIDNLMALAWRHDYAAAKTEAARAATLDPTFFFAPFMQGWIELQSGHVAESIAGFEKARTLESPPFAAAWLGYAYGAAGDRERARAMMEEVKKASLHGYVPPFNLALIHLGLGDREKALDDLEKAYAADSQWLIYIRGDRTFDPLRSEPRFHALLKKLHFEN